VPEASVHPILELRSAVDALEDLDPAETTDAALASHLVRLRREIDRLEGVFARQAFAGHRRGVAAQDGHQSTVAWLGWKTGIRMVDAHLAINAGEVTEILPETGAAWRSGDITGGAADTIIRARVPGHDEKLVAVESEFLAFARRNDLWSLRRLAGHFRNTAHADGSKPPEPKGLHISPTGDGRAHISGELVGLGAETVITAINAFTDRPSVDDDRTPAQRRADALVRICKIALAAGLDAKGSTAHASFVIDWTTLTAGKPGRMDGEFIGPIHPAEIARLLCDSSISRIVTGPDSLPLDVGRSRRAFPPAIRRAIVVRDGHCRWPGCERPPGWCEAHHHEPWEVGGETKIGMGYLACSHHHHFIHAHPDWNFLWDGHTLRVCRPDGTEVRAGPVESDRGSEIGGRLWPARSDRGWEPPR
jgi:Domain of unknown function DUF222.